MRARDFVDVPVHTQPVFMEGGGNLTYIVFWIGCRCCLLKREPAIDSANAEDPPSSFRLPEVITDIVQD